MIKDRPPIGSRVKLARPDAFTAPFNDFAREGRPATVIRHSAGSVTFLIAFDVHAVGFERRTLWVTDTDTVPA